MPSYNINTLRHVDQIWCRGIRNAKVVAFDKCVRFHISHRIGVEPLDVVCVAVTQPVVVGCVEAVPFKQEVFKSARFCLTNF